MIILGIESSCDDTSVALIDITDKKIEILSEQTASQIEIHKKYGGVIPEIAGRKHAEKIVPLVEEVLKDHPTPDAIAVTAGPGLMTGLLVGVEVAKTLSYLRDIPLVQVNHIEGHLYSVLLSDERQTMNNNLEFPAVALIVSGGHTELILMKNHREYELIGKTRDDAAGEAFDKVAKLLGLPYPGGPKISKLALDGDVQAINFPRPMKTSDNFDFSFSGLKTAALYYLRDNNVIASKAKQSTEGITANAGSNLFGRLLRRLLRAPRNDVNASVKDVCASFEEAVVDVLTHKTAKAVKKYKAKTLCLAGGVSANKKLRERLKDIQVDTLLVPPLKYCMDNATMIAVAGYFHARENDFISWKDLQANPVWKVYG